jgi:hypothetical protein
MNNILSWLKVPPIIESEYDKNLLYGSEKVIADYCGLKYIPLGIKGEWQHGCTFPWVEGSPEALIGGNVYNKKSYNWVARKSEENSLKKNDYNALAIGLPICYLPNENYSRKINSLLVMPAHSSYKVVAYTSNENNNAINYINYINEIKNNFTNTIACLHKECILNNLWIEDFKNIKINVIQGASSRDINALPRIKALMSQFEYVTSNVIGSHIFYAAAFGAKVSISGPFHKWNKEAHLNDKFYIDNQQLLDWHQEEEELTRKYFPFLFVEPHKAKQHIDWGKEMIGYKNVVSKNEMIELFKLKPINEFNRRLNFNSRLIARKIIKKLSN